MDAPAFTYRPIGFVRTPYAQRMDAPHQPTVVDVKPYVPYPDAFPGARAGWIDAVDAASGRDSAPGPQKPRKA